MFGRKKRQRRQELWKAIREESDKQIEAMKKQLKDINNKNKIDKEVKND